MKHYHIYILSLFFIAISGQMILSAQEVITLKNPSFEGFPAPGSSDRVGITAIGWTDCGGYWFPKETPPDIHPGPAFNPWFGVTTKPQDGQTFLGMVVRDNDTWECVSQQLSAPLKAGTCYSFSIYLAKSLTHVSNTIDMESQTESCVLRIHGGNSMCSKKEILAETQAVNHAEWKRYDITFQPKFDCNYIALEAFYKTPVLFPYKGNILVDHASDILEIPCPGEEPVILEEEEQVAETVVEKKTQEVVKTTVPKEKKKKIMEDLDAKKLKTGQKIRIRNLYFEADKAEPKPESNEVLDEIAEFLVSNKNIRVEIGGHTNGTPEHEYCDSLSNERARSIARHLIQQGVEPNQLEYRGYGKRKPIASNSTKEGREKNQRVEIKILSING
jgi:outer membrane protein OmpA-like peptidoglycan-associated protein